MTKGPVKEGGPRKLRIIRNDRFKERAGWKIQQRGNRGRRK